MLSACGSRELSRLAETIQWAKESKALLPEIVFDECHCGQPLTTLENRAPTISIRLIEFIVRKPEHGRSIAALRRRTTGEERYNEGQHCGEWDELMHTSD